MCLVCVHSKNKSWRKVFFSWKMAVKNWAKSDYILFFHITYFKVLHVHPEGTLDKIIDNKTYIIREWSWEPPLSWPNLNCSNPNTSINIHIIQLMLDNIHQINMIRDQFLHVRGSLVFWAFSLQPERAGSACKRKGRVDPRSQRRLKPKTSNKLVQ